MRLRRLDLARYGRFTDKVLDFGEAPGEVPDLTLIVGANEAGKSTTFDALLSLLFGIEPRTGYAFLHDYKSMEVGGVIDVDGRRLALRRSKAAQNSLRDASGGVVLPGALGATIGGLTRETYRAMFSLDEKSLREGGEAILASKGELGAMLFAASSGLSEIAGALEIVQKDADALHRPRAHATRLREAIKRLDDLRKAQGEIDINVGAFEALREAAERTRQAHAEADHAVTEMQRRLAEISRLRSALPLVARYRADLAALAPMAHWPPLPAEWAARADHLAFRDAELAGEQRLRRAEIVRLDGELAELVEHPQALHLAEPLDSLADLRARYRTAALDLPRRLAEQRSAAQDVARAVMALGLDAGTEAEGLVLPAAISARIADLADQSARIDAAAEAAQEEFDTAEAVRKAREAAVPSASAAEDGVLAGLVARMTAEDGVGARNRLADEIAAGDAKRTAISLMPFNGDAGLLAGLPAPEPEAARRMGRNLSDAETRLALARRHAGDAAVKASLAQARADALARIEGLSDTHRLVDLAEQRARAWQAHRAALDAQSADVYSGIAQSEREALTGNLARAERLGAWRGEACAAEVARVEVSDTAKAEAAAMADLAQVRAGIDAVLDDCGLPAGLHPDDFALWLERRREALALDGHLAGLRARHQALDMRVKADFAALADGLARHGGDAAMSADLPALLDGARAMLGAEAAQRAGRAAAERALQDAQRDSSNRLRVRDAALAAREAWRQDWRAALARTWIGQRHAETIPSVAEIRATLLTLQRLQEALADRSRIDRQVESMQQDQTAFITAVEELAAKAGLEMRADDPLETAQALDTCVAEARRIVRMRTDLSTRQDAAKTALCQSEEDADKLAGERDMMFARCGVTSFDELRVALAESAHAYKLREDLAQGARDIPALVHAPDVAAALQVLDPLDGDVLAGEAGTLSIRLGEAMTEAQRLHADWREAQKAFDAVGADDRAARLAEERRTTAIEIEEIATHYLKLRIGIAAVDGALRSYRDRHRSGMLNDAAARFRRITGGSFTDLRTQAADKGEMLVAIRRDGGSLAAEDMSSGTRNQLFFALRMAGYMEFVQTRDAVPFVGDDVMETFDDQRSAATFEMLADVARQGQVIYLTHHDHLVEIARRAVGPGLRVIRLDEHASS